MGLLTQQKLDDAPDWATHWSMTRDGKIMYESKRFWQTTKGKRTRNHKGVSHNATPIPRKEFDVTNYEFSDDEIEHAEIIDGALSLVVEAGHNCIEITKKDATALAKHFKLTAEDLK